MTHAPHWIQAAYESDSSATFASWPVAWIAPVGHADAQARQAVQRLKSMTGNPNGAALPNGSAR